MTVPSCRVCGRRLADPGSRARGVGPVCERRTRGHRGRRTFAHSEPDRIPGQTEIQLPPMQHELTWST